MSGRRRSLRCNLDQKYLPRDVQSVKNLGTVFPSVYIPSSRIWSRFSPGHLFLPIHVHELPTARNVKGTTEAFSGVLILQSNAVGRTC